MDHRLAKALFPNIDGSSLDRLPSDMIHIISHYLMALRQKHVSVVLVGHVDAGKTTLTRRLLFELGSDDARETLRKEEAATEEEDTRQRAFSFYPPPRRARNKMYTDVTVECWFSEIHTSSFRHYTIIDAPGHRCFIKNMITGASQADVAIIMVPADGNFTTSIARGNRRAGEVMGQTRHHALLVNLLGIKQIIVCINKMDTEVASYKYPRYTEIVEEMRLTLMRVGWTKKFVEESVPMIPISAWTGDNVVTRSEKMPWWHGTDIMVGTEMVHVETILDCLEKMVFTPPRGFNAPLRVPIARVYNIKGVGSVFTGRIEQGSLVPDTQVKFLHSEAEEYVHPNPPRIPKPSKPAVMCTGTVQSIEMHKKAIGSAIPGDVCAFLVKGIEKDHMPCAGDVMILYNDATLRPAKSFACQVRVLDHPGEIKLGYTPFAFARTGHAPCRLTKIIWKVGRETGNAKLENPRCLKANEMAEVEFITETPFVVDTFKNCEGFGRIAMMEGPDLMLLGKVIRVEFHPTPPTKVKESRQ